MAIHKQLSVFVENKVGGFYELCSALSKAEVNILGVLASNDLDWGVVRIVVDDVAKAKLALNDSGYVYGENEIIALYLDNYPGALAIAAEKLSKAKIAIEYIYATAEDNKALVLLTTSNNKKAEKILTG